MDLDQYGQLASDAEAADADTEWRGNEQQCREAVFLFGSGSAWFNRGGWCVLR